MTAGPRTERTCVSEITGARCAPLRALRRTVGEREILSERPMSGVDTADRKASVHAELPDGAAPGTIARRFMAG